MKILYVTTVSNTVNAFLIPHIKELIDQGHQVDIAFNVEQEIRSEIKEMGCKVYLFPFQRSPFKMDNYRAYKLLKLFIENEQYDIVHTHTPIASAIVRLACRNIKRVKVFYTAHGFHFFKGAPLKNWLLYYPLERWLARYTDVLITINNEDNNRAKKFGAKKIEYIPGVGINTDKFSNVVIDKNKKRQELNISDDSIVLLSIGELSKRKNHEVVIKAIAKIDNPRIKYLICGSGELDKYLKNLVRKLNVEHKVMFLGFRRDIDEICKISDIFVFPSYQEGLPVALMEAMAAGLPIVCSNIRGNTDLIEDGKGGYLVKPNDVDGFVQAIEKLISDSEIVNTMAQHNVKVVKKFDIDKVRKEMIRIYKMFIN